MQKVIRVSEITTLIEDYSEIRERWRERESYDMDHKIEKKESL